MLRGFGGCKRDVKDCNQLCGGLCGGRPGRKGLIPLLRRMKAGQSIKEIGPTWHMSKQGTPTMGGLMFIIGSAAAVLLLGWPDFAAGRFGGGFVLLFALVFGVIGYIDDYVKVKSTRTPA